MWTASVQMRRPCLLLRLQRCTSGASSAVAVGRAVFIQRVRQLPGFARPRPPGKYGGALPAVGGGRPLDRKRLAQGTWHSGRSE